MKSSKASKTSSRVRNHTRSVKISSTAHGLTNQAGLIPVVKYLDRIGFEKTVKRKVAHPRGNGVRHFITDMPSKQVGACAQRAMWRFSLGNCFLRTAKLVW